MGSLIVDAVRRIDHFTHGDTREVSTDAASTPAETSVAMR